MYYQHLSLLLMRLQIKPHLFHHYGFVWLCAVKPLWSWTENTFVQITFDSELSCQQHAALQLAKKIYEKAQPRSKAYADKNRTEITFKVDDLVLLATKNLKRKGSSKLLMPYCGPFKVTKVISPLAYQLDLPGRWRIHDVLHVSLLKPFKPRGSSQQYIPLPQLMEGEEEHEIESIVDHRIKEFKRRGKGFRTVRSFYVKWKHFSAEHDQWVTEANMTADFTFRNSLLDEYCNSHNLPLTIIKSVRSAPVRRKTHKRTRLAWFLESPFPRCGTVCRPTAWLITCWPWFWWLVVFVCHGVSD